MNEWLPAVCYGSAAVFAAGMAWRIWTWLRAPVPLKIVLTPAPRSTVGVLKRLAGEALLFRSLFGADPWLWGAAWLFHCSLVLLAIGHFSGLVIPGLARACLGASDAEFGELARVTGGVFGVLALAPLLWLLARRLTNARLRYLSTLSDYAALALLLLVIATGNQMRFVGGLDLEQARRFVAGLVRLHPASPPANAAFTIHVLLVCVLLVFIPFSKLVHLGGLLLSPTFNQRNDPRERRHGFCIL